MCEPGDGAQAQSAEQDVFALNKVAEAAFLFERAQEQGQQFWGGLGPKQRPVNSQDWPRGVDTRADFYPHVRPHPDALGDVRCNNAVPETVGWLRDHAPMPPSCTPPVMAPVPVPEYVEFAGTLPMPADLPRDPNDWVRVQRWCEVYEREFIRCMTPDAQGRKRKFRYKKLEGGRRGLLIRDYLKEEYAPWAWSLREWSASGGKKPCTPERPHDAQQNSMWDLAAIKEAGEAISYPDQDILMDLCVNGIRSHAEAMNSNIVLLAPNYSGFWEWPEHVSGMCEGDRTEYAKPRIIGSYRLPPVLCCRIHPRSVAVQPQVGVDEQGKPLPPKKRTTLDPACPRPPRGLKWQAGEAEPGCPTGPLQWEPELEAKAAAGSEEWRPHESWNDSCDMADRSKHPHVKYASVDQFARQVAVLKSAGLPVAMLLNDLSSYYRWLPTYWRERPANLQWVDVEHAIEEELMLVFGATTNCAAAQRVSFLLLTLVERALWAEQKRWVAEGLVPAEQAEQLAAWTAAREKQYAEQWAARLAELQLSEDSSEAAQAKMEEEQRWAPQPGQWFGSQVYIDDFMHTSFDFFIKRVDVISAAVLAKYGVDVADGALVPATVSADGLRMVPPRQRKNKKQLARAGTSVQALGIVIDPLAADGRGWRCLDAVRAITYAEAGEAMLVGRVASRRHLQSWLGRVVFAASALPELRPCFLRILSTLRQGWSKHDSVSVGATTKEAVTLACGVLRRNKGCALWPLRPEPGAAGRSVIWTWTDSARAPDAPPEEFVGWGAVVFVEGLDTVWTAAGRWSAWEQQLDITTLEGHVQNLALEMAVGVAADLKVGDSASHAVPGRAVEYDVIQVCDNRGARHVFNELRAGAASLRVITEQRMARQASRPGVRTFGCWANREFCQPSDDLSKGKPAEAIAGLRKQLSPELRAVRLQQPRAEWRSLDPAVSAKIHYEARVTEKSACGPRARRARRGGRKTRGARRCALGEGATVSRPAVSKAKGVVEFTAKEEGGGVEPGGTGRRMVGV